MSNIVIVCLGSRWYVEDRVGLEVCKRIRAKVNNENIRVIECETGLEDYVGPISREDPSLLIIVDSVLVHGENRHNYESSIIVIDNLLEMLSSEKWSFVEYLSSHKMPLLLALKLIKLGCPRLQRVCFVGIPIRELTFCPPDEDVVFPYHVSENIALAERYILDILKNFNVG